MSNDKINEYKNKDTTKIFSTMDNIINNYRIITKNNNKRQMLKDCSKCLEMLKPLKLTEIQKISLPIYIHFLKNERNKLSRLSRFLIDLDNIIKKEIEIDKTISIMIKKDYINKTEFNNFIEIVFPKKFENDNTE